MQCLPRRHLADRHLSAPKEAFAERALMPVAYEPLVTQTLFAKVYAGSLCYGH